MNRHMSKRNITPLSRCLLYIHRALARGEASQFIVFLIILLIIWGAFILGCVVFHVPASDLNESQYEADNLISGTFYHLFTNGGQNLMSHKIGWLITVLSIVLVAAITSLLTNYFSKVAQSYLDGETHYVVANHVAIFGYHKMLNGLLRDILSNGKDCRFILIQTNRVDEARKELSQVMTRKQMGRLIIQNGDMTSPIGNNMHVKDADEIFIIGEEREIEASLAHDDAVLQCLRNIVSDLPVPNSGEKRILCHVMFEQHSTFAVFQRTDLNNEVFEKLAFLPFNYYETWARKVFVNDSLTPSVSHDSPYLPLEGEVGIGEDSKDHVHVIIVGMSHMGISMGTMAAHLAHYPNFIKCSNLKTRITFIDQNARNEMYRLQGRLEAMFQVSPWRYYKVPDDDYGYSGASIDDIPWHNPLGDTNSVSPYKSKIEYLGKDFVDIEWEFIQGEVENPSIQSYIEQSAKDENVRLTVAVCLLDPNLAVAVSVNFPPVVYDKAVQVLVYQPGGNAIINALSSGAVSGFSPYSRVHAFGMTSDCYNLELIRKLVYVASYQKREDKQLPLRDMVDRDAYRKLEKTTSSKAAAANLWSTIYNASHMWTKLRSVSSTDGSIPESSIDVLSQTEHNRWTAEQLLTQFRPLLEEEQQAVLNGTKSKDELKRTRFAHLDICSMARLFELEEKDKLIVKYDQQKVERIPIIYKQLQESI